MWKKIISEIQEHGSLTQYEIGEKCGTSQSTISSLVHREGSDPSFSLGEKLKNLHRKVTKRSKKEVANV